MHLLDQWAKEGRISHEASQRFVLAARMLAGGALLPQAGVLAQAMAARKAKKEAILVHPDQAEEAAIVNDVAVISVTSESEAIAYIKGEAEIAPLIRDTRTIFQDAQEVVPLDMADIIEDENAKHALEIAAIGHHHAVLVGNERSGRMRLAAHVAATLPKMTLQEALSVTLRYSDTGKLPLKTGLLPHRPTEKIGPYSSEEDLRLKAYLSHLGVLIIENIEELDKDQVRVIHEVLAQRRILWEGKMAPCQPQMIGLSTKGKMALELRHFFDLYIDVPIISIEDHLRFDEELESSLDIRERIESATARQSQRFSESTLTYNAHIPPNEIDQWVPLQAPTKMLMNISLKNLGLSPKIVPQARRVAQSIADRVGDQVIQPYYIAEAIQYFMLMEEG
ncbi:MAG: ATP-binding protein [Bacteroidota bacterium]